MATRDILVVIDDAAAVARLMPPAAGLAAAAGARVTGLFPIAARVEAAYGDVASWMQLVETYLAAQRAEAGLAEAAFRQELAQRQLAGDWVCRESAAPDTATALAAMYDLVVVGQPNPDAETSGAAQPEGVVLGAGRPVLVVPYAGSFGEIGRRVLVAWNGSREAARALHDAAFILERAEAVTILEVAEPHDNTARLTAPEVAAALGQRGIAAHAETEPEGDIGVEDLLLSRAADLDADLLVMGAYGHSRLREYVLGGVSRGIFRHMTLPVLMAH